MIDNKCVFCNELVYASPKPETWGVQFNNNWIHYRCANSLFEIVRRVEEAKKHEEST